MAKQRQPIQLIQAKGRKHLTKDEIEFRKNTEVQAISDDIQPPGYLTEDQVKRFENIAAELDKLGVMGNTDCEALARYVVVEELFEAASQTLQDPEIKHDPELCMQATTALEKCFKMCRAAANDLGLTISSRCKLVVPKADEDKPENKFSKFERTG